MIHNRKSPIWLMPKEEFATLVKSKKTISDILRFFGLKPKGANHQTVKNRIKKENIDISHIPLGKQSNRNRIFQRELKPLDEILVKNSTYNHRSLKRRIIKEKLLKYQCAICKIKEWRGEKLLLILDHRNGIWDDNRLKNLRLLCPNCDSQMLTYTGRNAKRYKKRYNCKRCGKEIVKHSILCWKCEARNRRKAIRPSFQQLKIEVKKLGYSGTGRKYKVSHTTIKRWLKS